MKAVFNILMVVMVLMSALTAPALILAQDYTLLEPSVLPAGQGTDGKVDFKTYIESGFKTFLAVVVIIAIVMLTASGLQYITAGSGGGKGEAKNRALAAMIGLLIALSSYLILRTINPALVDLTLDINDQRSEGGRDIVDPELPDWAGGGQSSGGGYGGVNTGGRATPEGADKDKFGCEGNSSFGKMPCTEFEKRAELEEYNNRETTKGNIIINDSKDGCSDSNRGPCRTYIGGAEHQVDQVVLMHQQLEQDCNCAVNLVISGAAEQDGHSDGSRHYSGNAIDIRSGAHNSQIEQYLQNNSDQIAFAQFESGKGAHWHIEFK